MSSNFDIDRARPRHNHEPTSPVPRLHRQAGRTDDAIILQEAVLTDSERVLGSEHPDTLTARADLASSYETAGRNSDAERLRATDA